MQFGKTFGGALLGCWLLIGAGLAGADDLPGDRPLPSCQQAATQEMAGGMQPRLPLAQMLSHQVLLFEGRGEGGSDALAMYRCSPTDARVQSYVRCFAFADAQAAQRFYAGQQAALTSRLGPPRRDSAAFGLPGRIRLWRTNAQTFSTSEFTEWGQGDARFHLLELQKLRAGPAWWVTESDMPLAAVDGASASWRQALSQALMVALVSAIIAAALALTPLARLRWCIAVIVPFFMAVEANGFSRWTAADLHASAGISLIDFWPGFLLGLLASVPAVWLFGRMRQAQMDQGVAFEPELVSSRAGQVALLSGMAASVAGYVWCAAQFRAPHDPGLPDVALLKALMPVLLLFVFALAATVWGTLRVAADTETRAASVQSVIGLIWSALLITVLVNVASEAVVWLSGPVT